MEKHSEKSNRFFRVYRVLSVLMVKQKQVNLLETPSSAESSRKMAFPRDLLAFALPSIPIRRGTLERSGLIFLNVSPYKELNFATISFTCSRTGNWSSPTGTMLPPQNKISAA